MKPVSFLPAVPVLTYQRVVDQIEQAIVSGEILPGERLPSERDLMVQFSVSRPTIREALRVLQSLGLVASRPGDRGGPKVLAMSMEPLNRSFKTMTRLGSLPLSELVQFRIVLEPSACRLAAGLRTDEQLLTMRGAVDRMQAAAEHDPDSFTRADLEFHTTVWKASHNRLLQICGQAVSGSILTMMNERMERSKDSHVAMEQSWQRDRTILEAIAAKDSVLAGESARAAIADYFSEYLDDSDRHALQLLYGLRE